MIAIQGFEDLVCSAEECSMLPHVAMLPPLVDGACATHGTHDGGNCAETSDKHGAHDCVSDSDDSLFTEAAKCADGCHLVQEARTNDQ